MTPNNRAKFHIQKTPEEGIHGVQVEGRSGPGERSRFHPRPLRPVIPPQISGDDALQQVDPRLTAELEGNEPIAAPEPITQSKRRSIEEIRSTVPQRAREYDGKQRAEPLNLPEFATDPTRFRGEATERPDGPNLTGAAPAKGDPFEAARAKFAASKGKPAATMADLERRRAGEGNVPPSSPPPPPPPRNPTAGRFTAPVSDQVKEGWTRVQVPSLCIPYAWNDIKVRVLGIDDLGALFSAIKADSYTMFLDALDPAIDCDIRELTGSDLRTLMYWWRRHSYQRSPYTLNWRSRYGNENSTSVFGQTQLETVFLEMAPEQYAEFRDAGIDFPRVRDAEYLGDLDLSDSDMWKAERAQYVLDEPDAPLDEDWYPRRIARLQAGGIAMLEQIREFKERSEHGPIEKITVVDGEFEPYAAAARLKTMAEDLTSLLRESNLNGEEVPPEIIIGYTTQVNGYLEEAAAIEEKIAVAEETRTTDEHLARQMLAAIKPREETKVLSINALDFFPSL